jgi:hypothetical protein
MEICRTYPVVVVLSLICFGGIPELGERSKRRITDSTATST